MHRHLLNTLTPSLYPIIHSIHAHPFIQPHPVRYTNTHSIHPYPVCSPTPTLYMYSLSYTHIRSLHQHPHSVYTPVSTLYTHIQSIHQHALYTPTFNLYTNTHSVHPHPVYTPSSTLYIPHQHTLTRVHPHPYYTYFLVRSGFMWQYHGLGTGSEAGVGVSLHFRHWLHCTQICGVFLKQFSSHSHLRRPHGCNITSNGTRPTFSHTICSIVAELAVSHF